jgi:phosphoribosylamine-glycine ligase
VAITTRRGFAVSVGLASSGYPGTFDKGKTIIVGEVPSGMPIQALAFVVVLTFFLRCGFLPRRDQKTQTFGGRVIAVSA